MKTRNYLKELISRALFAGVLLLCALPPVPAQTSNDAVKEAQRLTRVAQSAEQQGRYDDAIKAYQTIAVVATDTPQVSAVPPLNAGYIYMSLGKIQPASIGEVLATTALSW